MYQHSQPGKYKAPRNSGRQLKARFTGQNYDKMLLHNLNTQEAELNWSWSHNYCLEPEPEQHKKGQFQHCFFR